MKKLTAGIFATILGVTAMGAADAAVTSKGYVDAALATKADATEVSTLSTTVAGHTTDIAGLKTADTTLQNNINTLAQNTTTSLNLKADKADVGTLPEGTSATTVVEYVDLKTKDIASSDTVTGLTTRVEAIEDDYITTQKLTDSQNAQNTTITAAYQAADATTLQAAKDYADANDADTVYDDAAVRGLIGGNTTAIQNLETNKADKTAIANMATTSDVAAATTDMATKIWVGEQNYVDETELAAKGYLTEHQSLADYATKTEAQGYANAKDAAISAAQDDATKALADAATADGKAVAAQTAAATAQAAAEAAQGTANSAETKANTNATAITNLQAFDNSIKTATEGSVDGTYTLTMKKTGDAMTFGWELIQRDGEGK